MSEETLKEERKEEPATAEEASPVEESAAAEAEAAGDAAQAEKRAEPARDAQKEAKEDGKKEKRRFRKPSKEEEKIEALEKEQAALNDRYLRLCAEYDNFRKRSQKEKDALYGDVKANAVSAFLPVYDNLERALKQGTEDEAYRKGVEMIMTQFCTTLEKLGVTPIECQGEKFDPALHNAVMHVEDEEKGENEIVEVFQKGFKLGDKVIRFAMVKVAN
ncbi:MAG: nucleotide exchange factor GrpE [Oscillospiraceae bacterium]|nr:nucleotide exchange factor GrpE [Oscillospiraceae bacterium]MBQ6428565.1 nucleotide exchange factor GrpE [Oscillospiraceae bacterium]